LEAAGLPAPAIVNSAQQAPLEGFSMLYAFDNAKARERHETQYFEMFCNRGIYHKGWTAVTRHSTPWDTSKPLPAFDDDAIDANFCGVDRSQNGLGRHEMALLQARYMPPRTSSIPVSKSQSSGNSNTRSASTRHHGLIQPCSWNRFFSTSPTS
jgi:hypothetical protein